MGPSLVAGLWLVVELPVEAGFLLVLVVVVVLVDMAGPPGLALLDPIGLALVLVLVPEPGLSVGLWVELAGLWLVDDDELPGFMVVVVVVVVELDTEGLWLVVLEPGMMVVLADGFGLPLGDELVSLMRDGDLLVELDMAGDLVVLELVSDL